jgi:hypothetical protein|tara:strand:+ start:76 stop:810 length:735 start_codon:yes stop_codon:yes gene_type:complete
VAYLISNIPYTKVWIRKEFTHGHQKYHGEFIHGLAIAVTTMPDRCLSFQIIFTGCEEEEGESNPHGGAMWARMPLTALCGDIPMDEWPERMETHLAQPWDCPSHHHSIVSLDRCKPSPWLAKIAGEFHTARYLFTVDYTESEIADCPAQHKQSHVMVLTDGKWKGNMVALPNNRVRVTSPALWVTGEGAPDFRPTQFTHCAEQDDSYMDPDVTFNNLYRGDENVDLEKSDVKTTKRKQKGKEKK